MVYVFGEINKMKTIHIYWIIFSNEENGDNLSHHTHSIFLVYPPFVVLYEMVYSGKIGTFCLFY